MAFVWGEFGVVFVVLVGRKKRVGDPLTDKYADKFRSVGASV